MTEHELRTDPEYFEAVWTGGKSAELRNNDRDFRLRDVLKLREYDRASKKYSGRLMYVTISHIVDNVAFLQPGIVMLSFRSMIRAGSTCAGWKATEYLPVSRKTVAAPVDLVVGEKG